MKKLVLLLFVGILISGCATSRLPGNATPDQIAAAQAKDAATKARACLDARQAYTMADLALNTSGIGGDATKYWNEYKIGAQLALTGACGPETSKTGVSPLK